MVITVTFKIYFPIDKNSGPFSCYIFCLWLTGKGILSISVLYSALPDNMLRYAIVSKINLV